MAMTGPLTGLLQYEEGYGGQGLTQEQYDMLGGDALLANLRKYDPNAYWERVSVGGGGEGGGSAGQGYQLHYDATKLPARAGDARSVGEHTRVDNEGAIVHDPVWGDYTSYKNLHDEGLNWIDYVGMAMAGTMLGGLAMGYGGAGAAGAAGASDAAAGAGAAVDVWDAAAMGNPAAYGLSGSTAATAGAGSSTLADAALSPDDYSWLMNEPGINGTQAAAPIVDASQAARVGDMLRLGQTPGWENVWQSVKELPYSSILQKIGNMDPAKLAALTGGGGGGGGGGGVSWPGMGLQSKGSGETPYDVLARFYGLKK